MRLRAWGRPIVAPVILVSVDVEGAAERDMQFSQRHCAPVLIQKVSKESLSLLGCVGLAFLFRRRLPEPSLLDFDF